MNISELQLEQPITEVDDFLLEMAIKHKLPSLLLSSIVLARLMHLNNSFNTIDDFKTLLDSISQGIKNKEFEVPDNSKIH
jgi:hypothetical protein